MWLTADKSWGCVFLDTPFNMPHVTDCGEARLLNGLTGERAAGKVAEWLMEKQRRAMVSQSGATGGKQVHSSAHWLLVTGPSIHWYTAGCTDIRRCCAWV